MRITHICPEVCCRADGNTAARKLSLNTKTQRDISRNLNTTNQIQLGLSRANLSACALPNKFMRPIPGCISRPGRFNLGPCLSVVRSDSNCLNTIKDFETG